MSEPDAPVGPAPESGGLCCVLCWELGPTQRKYWAQGQSLGLTLAALRGTHDSVRKWYWRLSYRELSRRLGSGCQAGGWGGRAPPGKRWKAFLPQSREPSVAPAGLSWPTMLPGPCLSPSGNAASYNLCQGGHCSAPFITMVMVMSPAGAPSLLADRMCELVHRAPHPVGMPPGRFPQESKGRVGGACWLHPTGQEALLCPLPPGGCH